MTRGKQIIEEAKRIIAEAHERGNNDPLVDLTITLSFTLGARWADKNPHWISVEDELPKYRQWVIAHTKHDDPAFYCTRYEGEELSWRLVSHWMPLPSVEHLRETAKMIEKGGEK